MNYRRIPYSSRQLVARIHIRRGRASSGALADVQRQNLRLIYCNQPWGSRKVTFVASKHRADGVKMSIIVGILRRWGRREDPGPSTE